MISILSKNSRFILILGLVVFFLFVMVTPVSASFRSIDAGNTVFIGETNLDITNAPFVPTSTSPIKIGWWASAAAMSACNPSSGDYPPDVKVDVTTSRNSFYVDPAVFVGHTGFWYHLNPANQMCSDGIAINVVDPSLDMKILDSDNVDRTDQSVPKGTKLKFKIITNHYPAALRSDAQPGTEGIINIEIQRPELYSMVVSQLPTDNGQKPLTSLFVNSPIWFWGGSTQYYWTTDSFTPGTYNVSAVSTLNNMNNNYNHVGKTISPTYTITLTTVTPTPTPTPPVTTVSVTPTPTSTTVSVTSYVPTPPVTTVAVISTPIPPSTTVTPTPVAAGDQSGILNQILNYFKGIFGWK